MKTLNSSVLMPYAFMCLGFVGEVLSSLEYLVEDLPSLGLSWLLPPSDGFPCSESGRRLAPVVVSIMLAVSADSLRQIRFGVVLESAKDVDEVVEPKEVRLDLPDELRYVSPITRELMIAVISWSFSIDGRLFLWHYLKYQKILLRSVACCRLGNNYRQKLILLAPLNE